MRLLNVHQLTLKYFPTEKNRPQYAILSHTWGDGEFVFQDLTNPEAGSVLGYSKVKRCCEEAKTFGLDYVWIDTCCIDKTSSAELSEAINSMYKWYTCAAICFAYLSDVEAEKHSDCIKIQLSRSRWFTRGWTLQELLAPQVVVFFNRDWTEIGTKLSLVETISLITDVPDTVLLNRDEIHTMSIAHRMSWAAKRKTTRTEDIAYCLMGLFDVNMPTLYGEGDRAFKRLQHEIMKISDDKSLFAWTEFPSSSPKLWRLDELLGRSSGQGSQQTSHAGTGLLSSSPRCFSHGRGIKALPVVKKDIHPFTITNHGLHIWLPLIQPQFPRIYTALLDCEVSDRPGCNLAIRVQEDESTGQYMRIESSTVYIINLFGRPPPQEIFVKETYFRTPNFERPQYYKSLHVRLHLPRAPLSRSSYNVPYSSVCGIQPGEPKFIDVGICKSKKCNISDLAYFVASANADPSVQALVAVRVSARTGLSAIIRAQSSQINSDVTQSGDAPNESWVRKLLENVNDHGYLVHKVEDIRVVDLNNGWKISVSFQRAIAVSLWSSTPMEDCQRQNYRVGVAFIQPGVHLQSDLKFDAPRLATDIPTFTPAKNPLPAAWYPRVTVSVTHKQHDNYQGVAFCLPRLNWVTKSWSINDNVHFSCQWTPTAYGRRAIMALGLQDDKITGTAILDLFIDDDHTVLYLLRNPHPGELSAIRSQIQMLVSDNDLTSGSSSSEVALCPSIVDPIALSLQKKKYMNKSRQRLKNFKITSTAQRSNLEDGGPCFKLEILGVSETSSSYT